VVISLVHRIPY